MTMWTDVITPAALTGYARQSLADRERAKGTLAVFLPNRTIPDITARFVAGANGLLDAAEYRAFDAETSIGDRPAGKRVTIDLPPLGRKDLVTEYEQLRARGNVDPEVALRTVTKAAAQTVGAIGDKIELMRGKVIDTGIAAIDENGFTLSADYGRSPSFNVTAPTLWSAGGATPLSFLRTLRDAYLEENGEEPGAILTSRRVLNAAMVSTEFKNLATNAGSSTPPSLVTQDYVQQVLSAYGLPPITLYERRARVAGVTQRVLPDNKLYMLPAATDPNNADGTDLGATFWGTTLEASQPEYGIAEVDRPGVVVGTIRTLDPVGVWVHGAGIGLPALANANLSLAATVL